jgi:hypothetical protein
MTFFELVLLLLIFYDAERGVDVDEVLLLL